MFSSLKASSIKQGFPKGRSANRAAVPSPPVVTGGTLTSDATYYYRVFTAGGTLSVTNGPLSCDVLIVAGGGGASTGGGGDRKSVV